MDTNTLNAVAGNFRAALDGNGRLAIAQDMVPAGAVNAFLNTLPSQSLTLETAVITPTGDPSLTSLEVTGHIPDSWVLPRVDLITLSDIEVHLTFQQDQSASAITSSLNITKATMASQQNSVLLAGLVNADGTVALTVSPQNHLTPTVALSDVTAVVTTSRLLDAVPKGIPPFDAIPVTGVDLSFGFAVDATTSIGISSHIGSAWNIVDGGIFSLKNPGISLLATHKPPREEGTDQVTFGATLQATTTIANSDYGVFLALSGADRLEFSIVPLNGNAVPGLLDFAEVVGGAALKSSVQTGIKALGFGDITVDSVRVGFSVSSKKLAYVTLRSHFTLAGGRVDLTAQLLPEFVFTGQLPATPKGQSSPQPGIPLNALATQIFGNAADLPQVTVTGLSLFAYPHLATYRISLTSTEDWIWDLSGHGAGPSLTLQQIDLNAEKTSQGATGRLGAAIQIGGFDIGLTADYQGAGAGWLFTGTGAQSSGVSVGNFLKDLATKLGASLPDALFQAAQSLQIISVTAAFDTHQKSFQFTGETLTKGQLPLGVKTYEFDQRVSISAFMDPVTSKWVVSGNLEGDLEIGNAVFAVSFDFGAATVFTGRWSNSGGGALSFTDIAQAIGIDDAISVPSGLNLGLKSASFEYHATENLFNLSGESALFGDAFFTTGKGQAGRWGFVFGVDSSKPGKLSDLPGIGQDLRAADFLVFKQTAFLVASTTFQNFSVPALPALPPAASSSQSSRAVAGRAIKPIASGTTLQLAQGLSLATELDFTTSTDARVRNLRSIVGDSKILLQATFGPSALSLFIELAGRIRIPAGGGSGLALSNPTVRIDIAPLIAFQVSGALKFTVAGTPVSATARLIISETEAQVAVSLSADQAPLPAPPGIKGLHIEQFGVEMGVFFEPAGVDLGLQGKLRIGNIQSLQANQFAFVLEMVGEVPNPLYLSFYIDRLDLGQALALFTDRTEPSLISAMEIVKASDLSFHWSESMVVLPDGSIAQPGFGFSASIQIFSFGAHADLEVGTATGIQGLAVMSPINLRGILQVSGDSKGIVRTYQQVNGQWLQVTNSSIVRQTPPLPTKRETVVPAGGPVIELNSLKSPFVHVNWNVTLFDLVRSVVDVTVSSTGFSFVLTYQVANIARFDMHCVLKDSTHFSAGANLSIQVDAQIGPIHVAGANCGSLHLTTSLNASLNVSLDPSQFSLNLAGSFSFEGFSMSMPSLTLSVAPSSLKELPGQAIQQIRNTADQIFNQLFSNPAKWADMISRGVVTGVTDMAGTLKNAYKVGAQQAVQLMKTAHQTADTVAAGLRAVYGLTASGAASVLKTAGYAVNEVASGLKTGYGLIAQDAATALKGAGYAADQVASTMQTTFGQTVQQAAIVLKGAGYAADEAGNALRTAYGQIAQQAANILRSTGYAADQVAGALRNVYGQTAQQAANILRGAGYTADQAAGALKSGYGVTVNAAAQLLRSAGYGVNEVGNALRTGWGVTADAATSALKGAGYAVNEVGDFVKNAYSLGPDALNRVLQGAGFTTDQIKGFFQSLGGSFADTFKDVGQKLDPTKW